MNIWLRFGFSHTIMADKDSKFLVVFPQTSALLNININVLSGENHDPMIVYCICLFINSCLNVFCNERGNNRVALEDILMPLYAWNSVPIVGTDISCSLLVTGPKFNFPIELLTYQHQILTSNTLKVSTFSFEQDGHFYIQKTMHFALNFYIKKQCLFRYVFIYKNPDTLRHILCAKNMHCALRFYI